MVSGSPPRQTSGPDGAGAAEPAWAASPAHPGPGELCGLPPSAAWRRVEAALAAAGCPDPGFDARALTERALHADPRLSDAPLTPAQAKRLAGLCAARQRREPLQYLLGRWPFLDLELAVGPGVLIPRADTEIVCEAAAACIQGLAAPRALDLCAGSGALALGLKRLAPRARVTALEKSPEAVRYLRWNAARALPDGQAGAYAGPGEPGGPPDAGCGASGPAGRAAKRDRAAGARGPAAPERGPRPAIAVVEGDVFAYHRQLAPASLDLIVSNPPYLTRQEMAALQPELRYEPAMALDGGADGLTFYRHIVSAYRPAVRPGGALVLEVGYAQAEAVAGLLAQSGWREMEIRRDLGGNPRVVTARAG